MNEHTSELLEIGIYAPIGLVALCAEKVVPVLCEEARNLRQQVPAAKFIGKMASEQVNQQLRTRYDSRREQLPNLAGVALSVMTKLAGERSNLGQGRSTDLPPSSQVVNSVPDPAPSTARSPDVDLDAIEGYENLSAPQVLALLGGLTEAELAEVEAFETSHRQRRTILNRIAQLRSA